MTYTPPTEAVEIAARAMDDNFNPDKFPIMAAMFRDYAEAALSAAGPAIAAQAKAEALLEAADAILTNDPLDYWSQHLPEGLGFQEAMSLWLSAHSRAASIKEGAGE